MLERLRTAVLILGACLTTASAVQAADLWNGAGYVDNGVVVGGQYGVGLYQGTPPRYIDRYYADSGLRPYFRRHHNHFDDVPAVVLERPEVPVVRAIQPRPSFRAYDGSPALSGSHTGWCSATYRSYRRSDNTFLTYNGDRRQCSSPYG